MRRIAFALLATGALVAIAWAQANNSNTWQTPGNQTVGGAVQLCPRAADNVAVPCNNTTVGAAGFPAGATPIMVSATGGAGTFTATIPAIAARTAYLCGFSDDAVATGASANTGTVTGLLGGTLNYVQPIGALTGDNNGTKQLNFSPCLPASAVNTAIVLNAPAPGAGGVQTAVVWGFYI